MNELPDLRAVIPDELGGMRLDAALARVFTDYSRALLARCIREGRARLDNGPCGVRDRIIGGEVIELTLPDPEHGAWQPEAVPIEVVHADDDIVVIDKSVGLVVHPGAGNPRGTLANGLLHRFPELAALPRAGIVHRLDKDTSGLLVVARSPLAHKRLVDALKRHDVRRVYRAMVHGALTAGGTVDAPIGRHRTVRVRMAVTTAGRAAVTHYAVVARFRAHCDLKVHLETGRTHQIRVHLAHIGHPLLGDPLYGPGPRPLAGADPDLAGRLRALARQALHAVELGFDHPRTGNRLAFTSPLPADMTGLLAALERDRDSDRRGPSS